MEKFGQSVDGKDETVALKVAAASLQNENKLIKGIIQTDVGIESDDKSWVVTGKDESGGRGRCEKLQPNYHLHHGRLLLAESHCCFSHYS